MATKKTWLWIIGGLFAVGVLGMLVIAGAGVYFVSQHIETEPSTGAEALRAFDAARNVFKDPPLFELDNVERVRVSRRLAQLPTSRVKPEHLWILAWDPEDERLVKVSLPFWLLRLGRRKMDIINGDRGFDLERLNLDIAELERIGPSLVVDHRTPSGERVLIWTQ